jgi:hypothetical protein
MPPKKQQQMSAKQTPQPTNFPLSQYVLAQIPRKSGRKRNRRRNARPSSSVAPSLTIGRPLVGNLTQSRIRFRHTEVVPVNLSTATATTWNESWSFFAHRVGAVGPQTKPLVYLSAMARLYDRWTLHNVQFTYKPSVGTTKDGSIIFGLDYTGAVNPTTVTRERVSQLNPSARVPVWQEASVRAIESQLMWSKQLKTSWSAATSPASTMTDYCPVTLVYAILGEPTTAYGDMYIAYDVTLINPSGLLDEPIVEVTVPVGQDLDDESRRRRDRRSPSIQSRQDILPSLSRLSMQ